MKSTPGKFACIWHFKWIGINAEKLKKLEFICKVTFSLPSPSSMIWRQQMSQGCIHPPRSITHFDDLQNSSDHTWPFPIIATMTIVQYASHETRFDLWKSQKTLFSILSCTGHKCSLKQSWWRACFKTVWSREILKRFCSQRGIAANYYKLTWGKGYSECSFLWFQEKFCLLVGLSKRQRRVQINDFP